MFSPVKFAKFLRTFFYSTPPVVAELVFIVLIVFNWYSKLLERSVDYIELVQIIHEEAHFRRLIVFEKRKY